MRRPQVRRGLGADAVGLAPFYDEFSLEMRDLLRRTVRRVRGGGCVRMAMALGNCARHVWDAWRWGASIRRAGGGDDTIGHGSDFSSQHRPFGFMLGQC